jgi:hypothetical protein
VAAAPSTLVQTDDAFRTHAGASGTVVRLGGGTAGGTTGVNLEESESWVRSDFGYAYARANLATASLHALSESVPASVQGTGASAVLRARLTFDVAGADRLTVTTIEVFWDQAGSVSDDLNLTWRSNLNLSSAGGGGTFQRRVVFDATPGSSLFDVDDWTLSFPDLNNPLANLPWSYVSDLSGNFTARGFVHLIGERPEVQLEAGLALLCRLGSDCDFDRSAYLRFGLPGNVTMTSESGLFLSALAPAVPEPGALALMLTGLLGVAGATRRAAERRVWRTK